MTPEQWKARCAARYMIAAGLTQAQAEQAATATFETHEREFAGLTGYSPEDAADIDMSYWED